MRLIGADMVGIEMAETWQKVLVKFDTGSCCTGVKGVTDTK